MGKKYPPQAFVEIPAGKFFRHGDRDGKLFPDVEFSVAIHSLQCGQQARKLSTLYIIWSYFHYLMLAISSTYICIYLLELAYHNSGITSLSLFRSTTDFLEIDFYP
jgi:hypothetical protein